MSTSASGSPELGLITEMRECTSQWREQHCDGEEVLISGKQPTQVDGVSRALSIVHSGEERWYLVTAEIPQAANGEVEFAVTAAGGSERVTISPGAAGGAQTAGAEILGRTGAQQPWALALLAVAGGLAVAGIARFTRTASLRAAHEDA